MFENKKYLLIIFSIIILIGASCSSKKIEPTYIPDDVSGVFCIDLKNVSNKATDFSNTIKVMSGDKYSFVNQVFNAGVDYSKKAYFFIRTSPELSQSYTAGYIPLNNKKKFEEALKKSTKENNINTEIKTKEDWKYIITENQVILMWNEKQVFFLLQGDKSDEEKLLANAQKIIKTPENQSLEGKQNSFKELLAQNFDASYWLNTEFTTPKLPYLSNWGNLESILSLPKMVESNYGLITFEKGEIITKNIVKFKEESFKKYKNIIKTSYDQNLAKSIPLTEPIFITAFALNMKEVEKMLDEWKFLEKLKIQVSFIDMKIEDFFTMISGDIVISGQTYGAKEMQDNDFVVALGLEKKEIFDKFINEVASLGLAKKKKNYFVLNYDDYRVFLIEKGNTLYLTLSADLRDKILNENNKINQKLSTSIGEQSLLFALDYNKLNKFIPWDSIKNSDNTKNMYQNIMKELDTFEMQAAPWGNATQITNFKLKLTNKSRNAVNVLAEIIDKINKDAKERKPNM